MNETTRVTLDSYVRWLRSWASPETVEARRKVAVTCLTQWGGVAGVTAENIETWLGRPGLSRWTRATYYSHMSDLCRWLVATERLSDNPMPTKKSKRPRTLPRPLSEVEVARVLTAAKGRQRDWILLALLAGLRAHEIAKIKGEDVSLDGIYVDGKGGIRFCLPIHPDLWEMAQRYPRRGYWFPGRTDGHMSRDSVTNYTGAFFRRLGIDGSIHRCRHVYGTRLLRAGVNIRTVQQLMRHANLDTTAAYTAVDEDELRAAIALLPSA